MFKVIREWWQSLVGQLGPVQFEEVEVGRRARPKSPRLTCPQCLRQVAYSPVLGRTARHQCKGGLYAQVAVPEVLDALPQAQ